MDSSRDVNPDPRRHLPAVDRLTRALHKQRPNLPAWAVTAAARRVLLEARERLGEEAPADRSGGAVAGDHDAAANRQEDWLSPAAALAERLAAIHPRPVINATGVVLHTNLGRSPLAQGAIQAVSRAAAGYSNLELELESGERGDRLGPLSEKLCLLSGAPAATACNNNAAALLLALNTLARGAEVIVSRGELVEIGGSFRVPEIMERAGVKLVEVGTTNRTHARDYERAIGPETALLLKVHRSNFALSGFVSEVPLAELVEIGRDHALPVIEDLGSGTLLDLGLQGFPRESYVPGRLRSGVDLVCFSGDKLLGGPQAGLVLGRESAVSAMRRNPLARALRLDKLTLAALDWTLGCMLAGRAEQEIPLLRRLLEPTGDLERRAQALHERLKKGAAEAGASSRVLFRVESDRVPVGGGSLPGFELATHVVAIRAECGAEKFSARLRRGAIPVLARVRGDTVIVDLRSIAEEEATDLVAAVTDALR
ncbi:MAG: L-seryl-tRNA(Sec) selenium transferase [Myxococcota bacterium]